jgi:glycosyltransferase involved in cell wall biosynthesis
MVLAAQAGPLGRDSERRRALGGRPRLVYGPVPILSFKYMSRAMRQAGYEATTVVHDLYGIHAKDDFDVVTDRNDFAWPDPPLAARVLRRLGRDYGHFAWILPRFDVFHCFFDGGFLRRTPLRRFEAQLLHRAGKRLVVMPYGSDVAIPSAIASLPWRDGLMRNYPDLAPMERETRRRLDYYSRRADFIVACVVHAETLPRWDLLTTLYYPIDTTEWAPTTDDSGHDGRTGRVVVVHAPNHRGMKGTEYLVAACRALRDEGLDVDLRLLEGVPNTEVHAAMAGADIVAEQFLLGFALTALEGMSLGKPVLSNLSEPGYYEIHRLTTGLDACPIVSTRPGEIADHVRTLVTDPRLRRELGEAGRRYVLEYHSYAAMARLWEAVYRRVWNGENVDPRDALPGRPIGHRSESG